jgi:hypothetical protein
MSEEGKNEVLPINQNEKFENPVNVSAATSVSMEESPNSAVERDADGFITLSGREAHVPTVSKVLLHTIPGQTAFASLITPFNRLSTEIAAVSIQHNLADGRGMNARTFDGVSKARNAKPEPQSPLFPKSNVPSPGEMLASDSAQPDRQTAISPTPQYLRTRTATSSAVSTKRQIEDIARMETIVMGR